MKIDKRILAGVRGSDPETGMNTFHEFLCVRASDYDTALARIAALEAALSGLLGEMAEEVKQRHHKDKYRVYQISYEVVTGAEKVLGSSVEY